MGEKGAAEAAPPLGRRVGRQVVDQANAGQPSAAEPGGGVGTHGVGALMAMSTVGVLDGAFDVEVRRSGSGPGVLWLHGEAGPYWGDSTTCSQDTGMCWRPPIRADGASTGGDKLDDIHDAIYFYLDLLDALQLNKLALIGHGLGGMFASELAAVQPERFSHLVLIDPFGLWLEDVPTLDYFVLPPAELAESLYHDLDSPVGQATARAPEGQEALVA